MIEDFPPELLGTSITALNSTGSASAPEARRTTSQLIWIFGGPFIFFIGLCGNILILLVMGKKRMRGTSASVYLMWMAAADLCVLIFGMIPEWLEQGDFLVVKKIHPIVCKLEKFAFYTSADTAIWVLCIFSVDRFIAVCFPFEKKDHCLPSRSKFFALTALVVAVIKNFHVFWTRGAEYYVTADNSTVLRSNCGRPTPEYKYFELFVRPWIAFTVVNALPFGIIIICNSFIVRSLRKRQRELTVASSSDHQLVQMAMMCLSASFSFLFCITPSIILLIGRPHWQGSTAYDVTKSICNQLVYVNHSINFFLYCFAGNRFRTVLMQTLTRNSNSADFSSRSVYRRGSKSGLSSQAPRYTSPDSLRPSPIGTPRMSSKNATPAATPFLTPGNQDESTV